MLSGGLATRDYARLGPLSFRPSQLCMNSLHQFRMTSFTFCKYVRNRINYQSTVKCVVKKKKSVFKSYAKLKIEICPQVVPFCKYCHNLLVSNRWSNTTSTPCYFKAINLVLQQAYRALISPPLDSGYPHPQSQVACPLSLLWG